MLSHHESHHEDDNVGGSPRGFGLTFAAVFALAGCWPLLSSAYPRLWALGVAAAFLLAALLVPGALQPLNRLWSRFGLLLGRIMTPVIMTLLFVVAVAPTAFVMRLLGHDPMRRRRIDGPSYWIERRQPPGSMTDQF